MFRPSFPIVTDDLCFVEHEEVPVEPMPVRYDGDIEERLDDAALMVCS